MSEVAIVLPSYGRPEQVGGCLESLRRLDGGPYRTIVVDDGSPMPLAPICEAAGGWVECLRQENAGPAVARNTGVRAAAGASHVCFIDDDCRPRPNWVTELLACQAGTPWRLVGGRVVNGLGDNLFSEASQTIHSYLYEHFGTFEDDLSFFTTNNMCVRRDDFLAAGGFCPDYRFASEDRDFSYRWRLCGGALRYAEDAVVEHRHELTLGRFLRQHQSYGRGGRQFHRTLARIPGGGIEFGSPRFYAGLLLHPLRRPSPRALVTVGLIGLAHVALLVGYLRERATEARA